MGAAMSPIVVGHGGSSGATPQGSGLLSGVADARPAVASLPIANDGLPTSALWKLLEHNPTPTSGWKAWGQFTGQFDSFKHQDLYFVVAEDAGTYVALQYSTLKKVTIRKETVRGGVGPSWRWPVRILIKT